MLQPWLGLKRPLGPSDESPRHPYKTVGNEENKFVVMFTSLHG